jgi:hypothetical protein
MREGMRTPLQRPSPYLAGRRAAIAFGYTTMPDERTLIFLLASDWQAAQTQSRPTPRWKFLGLAAEGNTTIRRYSIILDDGQKSEG